MSSEYPQEPQARRATVVVASSAGGIEGLQALLGGLGADFPAPVLVAHHLRRARETRIVAILSRHTTLTVKLAEQGELPEPGTVYVAPPDHHLCVREDGRLALSQEAPVNMSRPAADPLFESAAETFGPLLIACVLTGADSDGARGVEAVKEGGGTVIVEDPATAKFHGMPKSAIETGRVDFVLDADHIPSRLHLLVRQHQS
ncbi:chemotaxis protein CheB [Streptomyces sp. NPDC051214]|uniref:chemotaxis protein CheB n=1 Tax=Streptomyces sp. NPDC051214 TaxID=3155282 RepID=UPI00342EE4F5